MFNKNCGKDSDEVIHNLADNLDDSYGTINIS